MENVPAASTITAILLRHGRLESASGRAHRDWVRFEHAAANDLWQMDFKGEFSLSEGGECFPLTVLDDHSRYALAIRSCGDQQGETVKTQLTQVFRRYGLPRRMLMDNGSPWGVTHTPGAFTKLTVWFLRLGIHVWHGHPYHPQTQGKDERFHRTLKLEVIQRGPIDNLIHAQRRFDPFRHDYNHERPHESLGMAVPASRYQVSTRSFPEMLPPVEYAEDVQVRKVNPVGQFSFAGRTWKVSEAFGRQPIGLRATTEDGLWDIQYNGHNIGRLDLKSAATTTVPTVDIRPRPRVGEAATPNPNKPETGPK
jgi:transposase InsO family protein